MVGAQERDDHDRKLRGHEREHDRVPALENLALEVDVRALASGKQAARVARLADGRLDERVEVPAAVQLVLDPETAVEPEIARPLCVHLALKVERAFLVRDVPRRYKQREANPKQERVYGQERPVVQQDTGPADERREDAKCSGDRRDDELRLVSHTNDVGVRPDIKVDKQTGDQTCKRVNGKLRSEVSKCSIWIQL